MARPPTYHKVPQSQRIGVTLDASEIRTLRKLAIDVGMPEGEVLHLALRAVFARYESAPPGAVAAAGADYFLPPAEPISTRERT